MTLDVTEACSRITGLYLQEVTSATTILTNTTYKRGLRSMSWDFHLLRMYCHFGQLLIT